MQGDIPTLLAGNGLKNAYLEIEVPSSEKGSIIPLRFNPTEYQLQKTNNFAEIPIPGMESPPIQYIRGASEKLSLELLLDTSDTMESVRVKYTQNLSNLMKIKPELHAPPIVKFIWDKDIFRGVVDSLSITFVMFTPQGVPVRAQVSLSLTEYRPIEVQVKEAKKGSPDTAKIFVVRQGDTLNGIAAAVYQDASKWRDIAEANGIRDPRRLEPGTVLLLPRLV